MISGISQVMCLHEPARFTGRRRGGPLLLALLAAVGMLVIPGAVAGQDRADRRLQRRVDEANRREAAVLVELADRVAAGQPVPADFVMSWRHDFLKAQPGTFVPFVLTVAPFGTRPTRALLYVRAARREPWAGRAASERRGSRQDAFDAVFPVDLNPGDGEPIRIVRGFAVPAGEYDVHVALRERPEDPLAPAPGERLRSGALARSLSVPDFWSGEFAASTVMLARRIAVLARPAGPEEALERPYAIGLNDVQVAFDATFRRDRELIVVFVIYNPAAAPGGHFDVQVDYHVFARGGPGTGAPPDGAPAAQDGERYVTRTNPQRFNQRTLGPEVDPGGGDPVMAGQGILLGSFDAGEYRLAITVTDLLSGKKLARDVVFRVAGS